MSSNLRQRPTLFGRHEEMRRLAIAFGQATEGRGRVIFLAGVRGIGKTRLAHEALALAKERGCTVLEGRSYSLGKGMAYAPILAAIEPFLHSLASERLQLLMSDLPALGRLMGRIASPHPPLTDGHCDSELEKTLLFREVVKLVEGLSMNSPVALFMDDIECADTASIELLHYLARSLTDQRALLLASFSPDALSDSRSLRELVESLKHDGLAEEVNIPRLTVDDVKGLAREMLAGDVTNEFVDSLYSRSSGYPLFVESLVSGLVDEGFLIRSRSNDSAWVLDAKGEDVVPASTRNLVLDHLNNLSATDRSVLESIAIAGDAASFAVLRAETGPKERVLFRSLRRLQAKGLAAERIDGADVKFNIPLPLIREVVSAEVPEIERRFQRAAIQTNRLFMDGLSSELAISSMEAATDLANPLSCVVSRPDLGYASASQVASKTVEITTGRDNSNPSPDATVAVEFDQDLAAAPDDFESLPWLLEQLGEAWGQFGDWRSAVDIWNEALTLLSDGHEQRAPADGRAVAISRLHRRLALAEWDRGHFDVANAHLKASFASSGDESGPETVDLNFTRHHYVNRFGQAVANASSAAKLLAVARRLASPRAEAEADLVATVFALALGDIESARQYAFSALKLGESFAESQGLAMRLRGHAMLTLVGMRLGDHHFMRYHAERGLAVAQRPGAPPMEVVPRVRLAHAYFMAGLWDEAVRLGMEAVGAGRRVGNPHYLAYALAWRAMILAVNGELPEAEACIAEVRIVHGSEVPEDRQVFSLVDIAEAALALERGQVERALGIARGFARPPRSWEATPAGVTSASKPIALMLLAEAQVAAGDPESALKTAHDLSCLGPPAAPYLTALSTRAEGLARLAQGRREEAIVCFGRAHESFTSLGMPFEAARALLELASAAALSQPAVAATAAHSSLASFETIGARRYADRARRLLRSLGISIPLGRRTNLPRGPLTVRQLQIARLVAEGLANSEIAEKLVLSQRTVTTHLDHIYARLGIGSRTALSRYVTETRLLTLEDGKL